MQTTSVYIDRSGGGYEVWFRMSDDEKIVRHVSTKEEARSIAKKYLEDTPYKFVYLQGKGI